MQTSGDRPVPSCLGGGDLDGDVYNLIPLDSLPEFLPERLANPANYEAVPKKEVDHPSTMTDVAEFVMEYINSDVRSPSGILEKYYNLLFYPGFGFSGHQLAHHCRSTRDF